MTGVWAQPVSKEESAARAKLVKIDDYKPPVYTEPKEDRDYKKDWVAGFLRYLQKRNDMIWDFVKTFPDHERAKPLMEEWFINLAGGTNPAIDERVSKALIEIDSLLIVESPPDWVKVLGKYYRSYYQLCMAWNRLIFLDQHNAPADDRERRAVVQAGVKIIEEFTNAYPDEPRGVRLFDVLAEACHDPVSERAIYARILADYPDHSNRDLYEGKMRREDRIGKPFEMEFDDALTGEPVQTADYQGKVLLVVFWAHNVIDCRKNMKEAKRILFRYEHEGLAVVDVSLDNVAFTSKKVYNDFVKDNKMTWRHFFQGSGIDSDFSKSWGVNSLPTWFLVDRKGNLRYVDAQRDSEAKIKALLDEKE